MTRKTTKRSKPKPPAPRQTGGARRGRKAALPPPAERNDPPGHGAALLRRSVNSLIGDAADDITQALIDKAKAGNVTGARILVELSGEPEAPPPPPKKKSRWAAYAEQVAREKEWEGPWADKDADLDGPEPIVREPGLSDKLS